MPTDADWLRRLAGEVSFRFAGNGSLSGIHETEGRVIKVSAVGKRVARAGRILCRGSLDEIPISINVPQGRMSVPGLCPHAVKHDHEFSQKRRGEMKRNGVIPHVTGFTQAQNFRGQTEILEEMQSRLECDIQCMKYWSLRLDLSIILVTFLALRDVH